MNLANKVKNLYEKMPTKRRILEKGRSAVIATLKATKVKKEDHILKKIGYSILNFVSHHSIIGAFPAEMQKSLAKDAGLPKNLMGWESIGFGVLLGVIKYASGDAVAETDMSLGGYMLEGWGIFRLGEAAIRTAYMAIKKEPIGILVAEWAYRMNPAKYEFKEEKQLNDLEKSLYDNIGHLNTWTLDNYAN